MVSAQLDEQPFVPCACCAPAFERIAARLRELEAKLTPPEPAPTPLVVHILAAGSLLCGLHPLGQTWVSYFDPEQRKLATCLACTRAAR